MDNKHSTPKRAFSIEKQITKCRILKIRKIWPAVSNKSWTKPRSGHISHKLKEMADWVVPTRLNQQKTAANVTPWLPAKRPRISQSHPKMH
jgi:hypothetical protein